MALLSTYRRLGEPVVIACGPSLVRGGLHAGLLFVAPSLALEAVTLAAPSGEERITVSIPREYLDLPEPQWFAGITLTVKEAE